MPRSRTPTLRAQGLAVRLRQAREEAGLTRHELGLLAGLSKNGVYDIENGKRINVGVVTIERLALALTLRAAWLAYGDGEPRAPQDG